MLSNCLIVSINIQILPFLVFLSCFALLSFIIPLNTLVHMMCNGKDLSFPFRLQDFAYLLIFSCLFIHFACPLLVFYVCSYSLSIVCSYILLVHCLFLFIFIAYLALDNSLSRSSFVLACPVFLLVLACPSLVHSLCLFIVCSYLFIQCLSLFVCIHFVSCCCFNPLLLLPVCSCSFNQLLFLFC